ncbi:hypothetical protein GCM10008992_10610 [Halorubrum aquaticum]
MPAGDPSPVAFVEQYEVDIAFDGTTDRRRLAEIQFVMDLDEQVRTVHLDQREKSLLAQVSKRVYAFRPISKFSPDLSRNSDLGKL